MLCVHQPIDLLPAKHTRQKSLVTAQQRHQTMAVQRGLDGAPVKKVVICGGGIIGAATAFYLAQQGVGAVVVERESIAAAASGKAGGFLALDWNDSSPVGPLARRSYALHARLADRFGREAIGYREVTTLQVVGAAEPAKASGQKRSQPQPDWLDGHITRCSLLGDKSTTAQVHPAKLTHALMTAAQQEAGAQVITGTVSGISTTAGAVTAVKVQQQQQHCQDTMQGQGNTPDGSSEVDVAAGGSSEVEVPADVVVLAMGPWTSAAQRWLPSSPNISGQKYHSVVMRPKQPVSDACVFTAFRTADGRSIEPELYPRPDGTVYVCGEPASVPVPPGGPAAVSLEQASLETLKDVAGSLSSSLTGARVEAEQACFLPLSDDGLPIIGRLPDVEGVYVASGHSCWGILNGPATGEALAELILHGSSKLDLAAFNPARFSKRSARLR